jgi:hypothetical protein
LTVAGCDTTQTMASATAPAASISARGVKPGARPGRWRPRAACRRARATQRGAHAAAAQLGAQHLVQRAQPVLAGRVGAVLGKGHPVGDRADGDHVAAAARAHVAARRRAKANGATRLASSVAANSRRSSRRSARAGRRPRCSRARRARRRARRGRARRRVHGRRVAHVARHDVRGPARGRRSRAADRRAPRRCAHERHVRAPPRRAPPPWRGRSRATPR